MNKDVRKNEIPIARRVIEKAGLYVVPPEDIDTLADVAADAYKDYPLHNWFSGGEYNPETTGQIIKISLKTMLAEALVYADSAEINGYVVWLPAGFTGCKTIPFLASGGLRLVLRSGIGIAIRLVSYEKNAMDIKKEITDNSDWYLYNLCVRQKAQGKGIASKLMRPMLDLCDQEQRVAYLETNKAKNLGMYEHFGFEVKKTVVIPKSNVDHYAMVRKPCRID